MIIWTSFNEISLIFLDIFINAKEKSNTTSDDPLGDILNDYK